MSAETKSGAEIGIQANLERRMGTMTQTSTGCQASPLQKSTVTYSVTPLSQRSENRFNFVDLGELKEIKLINLKIISNDLFE